MWLPSWLGWCTVKDGSLFWTCLRQRLEFWRSCCLSGCSGPSAVICSSQLPPRTGRRPCFHRSIPHLGLTQCKLMLHYPLPTLLPWLMKAGHTRRVPHHLLVFMDMLQDTALDTFHHRVSTTAATTVTAMATVTVMVIAMVIAMAIRVEDHCYKSRYFQMSLPWQGSTYEGLSYIKATQFLSSIRSCSISALIVSACLYN